MTPSRTVTRQSSGGRIDLAVYEWGTAGSQPTAPTTIVLVHGYPDSARVWAGVAERLAKQFHVVAYDVRGAGASTAPKRVRDYAIVELMDDLAAVLNAVSPLDKVHLVGHDWGSIQCWEGVATAPLNSRIASYTSISGPSLDHVGTWLREHAKPGWRGQQLLKQLVRSWYVFAFQLPGLAPAAWKYGIGRQWPRLLKKLEGTTAEASPTQIEDGRNGVNLYRANVLPRLLRPQPRHAAMPVQLIVPLRDRFVGPEMYEGLSRWVPVLRRRAIDAGHWLLLSHPDQVARCIREWVDEHAVNVVDAELAPVRAKPRRTPKASQA